MVVGICFYIELKLYVPTTNEYGLIALQCVKHGYKRLANDNIFIIIGMSGKMHLTSYYHFLDKYSELETRSSDKKRLEPFGVVVTTT